MRVGIVGGSLSGIMAGVEMKTIDPRAEVVIFEQNDKLAKKIYATGNGHCNLLHRNALPSFYNCPDFIRGVFARFSPQDMEKKWQELGVPLLYHGELAYPLTYSAPAFVRYLEKLLQEKGVKVRCLERLVDYHVLSNKVELITSGGKEDFDHVIFCTGGASGKNLGTDGSMAKVFEKHHYVSHSFLPVLCPIRTAEHTKSLAGVRHDAKIRIDMEGSLFAERGEILWKKDGLSGIAIFNASLFLSVNRAKKGTEIHLDLFPDYSLEQLGSCWVESSKKRSFYLDGYLAEPLARYLSFNGNHDPMALAKRAKDLVFHYQENYGFEDSQVSLGGISLGEVDEETLRSKKETRVSFAGECLDVAGYCGGYNLLWAAISGILAARGVL